MTDLPLSACWTLADHVDRAAARWPDADALVFGADRATFASFADRTRAFARGLLALGVEHGDRVGVLMPNILDTLVAIYGASRLGAIPVPINNRFRAPELAYVFGHAGIRVLVTAAGELRREADAAGWEDAIVHGTASWDAVAGGGDARAGAAGAAGGGCAPGDDLVTRMQRRVAVSDIAMLMYTSGTTANPKGCRLSHEALVRTARVVGEQRFPMRAGDRQFNPLPLFHLATILPFNGCLAVGAAMIGMEHFDAGEALRLLREERCTVAFPAFTLIWQAMLDHPDFDPAVLKDVRLVNVNGDPEITRPFAARTPDTLQISPYGATEGGGVIALSHLDDPLEQRIGTAGRPFDGIEARIADPGTGAPLGPGEPGEITYRGWSLFDGYHDDPEATAKAFDADGYFHSGDLGTLDADGRLTYLGRLKDMLKVGGENVGAAEIEGLLAKHPAVAVAQVVAAPDAHYYEVPCAYVELRPGTSATEAELVEHCLGKVATFKVPRYVRFLDEWPMSGTKIQKFMLRERIAAELAEAGITQAEKVRSVRA